MAPLPHGSLSCGEMAFTGGLSCGGPLLGHIRLALFTLQNDANKKGAISDALNA
jgi:hypothetical protein